VVVVERVTCFDLVGVTASVVCSSLEVLRVGADVELGVIAPAGLRPSPTRHAVVTLVSGLRSGEDRVPRDR
jgi:hypothetical protein